MTTRLRKVLIVEDDRDIADTLTHVLRDTAEVHIAYSNQDALDAIRHVTPDIVLADILLSDGEIQIVELCLPLHPKPRVILVSALQESRVRHFAEAVQAEAYLIKPFTLEELDHVLR